MKKFSFKLTKRRSLFIAYTAILIALNVALKFCSVLLGSFSISFSYIPCFIAGMFLGPISGGMVGLLGDLIGTLAKGFSPSPFVTISCMLIGVIPGLVFMIKKLHPYIKLTISLVLVLFICTLGLSSYGTWLLTSAGANEKSFATYWLLDRLPKQPVVMAINAAILYIIYYPLKKLIFDRMGNKIATTDDVEQLEKAEVIANTTTDLSLTPTTSPRAIAG